MQVLHEESQPIKLIFVGTRVCRRIRASDFFASYLVSSDIAGFLKSNIFGGGLKLFLKTQSLTDIFKNLFNLRKL